MTALNEEELKGRLGRRWEGARRFAPLGSVDDVTLAERRRR